MSSRRRPNRAKNAARANHQLVDLNALASDVRTPDVPDSSAPEALDDGPAPGPPPRRSRVPTNSGPENGKSEPCNSEPLPPPPRQGAVQPPKSVIGRIQPDPAGPETQEQQTSEGNAQNSGIPQNQESWKSQQNQPPPGPKLQQHETNASRYAPPKPQQNASSWSGYEEQDPDHFRHQGSLPLPSEDPQEDGASAWDEYTNIELEESQQLREAQDKAQTQSWEQNQSQHSNYDPYASSTAQDQNVEENDPWDQELDVEIDEADAEAKQTTEQQDPWDQQVDANLEEEDAWDQQVDTNIETKEPWNQQEAKEPEQPWEQKSQHSEQEPWNQQTQHSEQEPWNQQTQHSEQEPWNQQTQHSEQAPWEQEPQNANQEPWESQENQNSEDAWGQQANEHPEQDPWEQQIDTNTQEQTWNQGASKQNDPYSQASPYLDQGESQPYQAETDQSAPWDPSSQSQNAPWDQQEEQQNETQHREHDQEAAENDYEQNWQGQNSEGHDGLNQPWEQEQNEAGTDSSAPWDVQQNEHNQASNDEWETQQIEPQHDKWDHQYNESPIEQNNSWNTHNEPPHESAPWDHHEADPEALAEPSHTDYFQQDNFKGEEQQEQQYNEGDYNWEDQQEQPVEQDSQQAYSQTAPQEPAAQNYEQQENAEPAPWDNVENNQADALDERLGEDDLDDFLDDDDFLRESESPPLQTADPEEEITQGNFDTVIHHPAQESHDVDESTLNKSKALEMLDLDEDLLLDEEFLEDEPDITATTEQYQQQTQPAAPVAPSNTTYAPAPASTQNKYAPSSKYAPSVAVPSGAPASHEVKPVVQPPVNPYASQTPQQPQTGRVTAVKPTGPKLAPRKVEPQAQEAASKFMTQIREQDKVKQELNAAKKKNDAYDFPVDLMKAPARAPRAGPRSGPSSVTSPPARPVSMAHGSHSTTSSQADTPAPSQSTSEKKNFFEEYPTNVVKPPTRAGRAAASSYTPHEAPEENKGGIRNVSSPQAATVLPAKSPKNPYAALQPKIPSHVQPNVPQAAQAPGPQFPQNKYQPMGPAPQGMAQQPPNTAIARPPAQAVGVVPPPGQQQAMLPKSPLVQHQVPAQNMGGQAFPAMRTGVQAQKSPRISINTAMPGRPKDKASTTSPYVPVSGPYAPSARGHSRTSSIVGGTAREGNPYAPVSDAPPSSHHKGVAPPATLHPGARARGSSMNRGNKPQPVSRAQNPNIRFERQFPVFHWSNCQNVTYLIPHQPFSSFEPVLRSVHVGKVSDVAKNHDLYADFPGPLTRGKTKKKEIETWLQKTIVSLETENPASEEPLLAKVLYLLVKFDGNFKNSELLTEVAKILTPNVDYSQETSGSTLALGGQAISANAYKLDNQGINNVWNLIQIGKTEDALSLALSKGDWALGFVIASSIGQERFAKVASDYARVSFPFQKGQIARVQHLMPIMMKIFVGNSAGVISDFEHVPSEGEFAKMHFREILAAAIVNNCSTEFLVDFGKFLSNSGMDSASELCFVLGGLVMTPTPLNNGTSFPAVGSFTSTSVYSEIYEYILSTSPSTSNMIAPTGLPHLLPYKLRRAQTLADFGNFTEARRYCDSLGSTFRTLGKSPYLSPAMTAEFQNLLIRLSDSGASDSGWLGTKFSKVNLDKMWGQLDKIIGGETATPRNQDTGVFSKFSPSVSRNASTLDITQIGSNGTQFRPELNRSSSLASAPAGHSSFSPMQADNRPHPSRFTPAGSGGQKKFPQALSAQPSYHPTAQSGNAAYQPHHVSNISSNSIHVLDPSPVQDEQRPSAKPSSSFAPRQPPARNPLYSNRSGQISSSSVGSHMSPQHHQQGKQPHHHHENFVLPEFNDNDGPPVMERSPRAFEKGHFRTSSLQSEAQDGIDGIVESQLPPTIAERSEESSHRPSLSKPDEKISRDEEETIEEKNEIEEQVEEQDDREKPETEPKPTEDEEPKQEDEAQKKPESSLPPPPISTKKSLPPRSNPYAPGASRGNSSRNTNINRYGPGASKTANKYAQPAPSQHKDFLEESTPNVSTGDALGNDQPNGEDVAENEVKDEPKRKPSVPENHQHQTPAPPGPPRNKPAEKKPNPYAPASNYASQGVQRPPAESTIKSPVARNANIDISMDYNADETNEESEPSRPPLPSGISSPPSKSAYANPFQINKAPGEGGLEEFSIPGSPEYTTRANSVIGNNGLFSSKLSQSQQSVMYQQYEVKDDTVHDYVPVPEDDDDEDDEKSKQRKKRKEEQVRKEQQNRKEEKQSKEAAQEREGWLSRLRGKKEDTPKAIKAKLGQKNTFFYSEEHKRWIDKSRPLEEQLKESAPPPPPTKKKVAPKAPGVTSSSTPSQPSSVPPSSEAPSETPSVAGKPPTRARRAPPGSLANANLEDLLSLSSGTSGGGRKQKRRYVNVLDKK